LVRVTELVLIHLSRSVPRRLDGALYMSVSQVVCQTNIYIFCF